MMMDAEGDRGHRLPVPLSRLTLIVDAIEVGLRPRHCIVKYVGTCHQRSGRLDDGGGIGEWG